MDFNAKLIKVEEPITGNGKNGMWKRQAYIFETEGQYPKKICVTVWGDGAIQNPATMQIGARLNVSFELESREYNGRWYTDVRAWRIQEAFTGAQTPPVQTQAQAQSQQPIPTTAQQQAYASSIAAPPFPNAPASPAQDDDLPF